MEQPHYESSDSIALVLSHLTGNSILLPESLQDLIRVRGVFLKKGIERLIRVCGNYAVRIWSVNQWRFGGMIPAFSS